MDEERSPSGAPIYRHEHRTQPERAGADPQLIEAVTAHLEQHVGPVATVWHEIVSVDVHLDIHIVAPSEGRPWTTLMTSGMAQRPMRHRDGDRYAELVVALPPDWSLPEPGERRDDRALWPLRLLQELAGIPHAFDTVLWAGHTVPNGEPARPYAKGTGLAGALIWPPVLAGHDARGLRAGTRDIDVFGVFLIHADEMQVKLDDGLERLLDLLDGAEVSELVQPARPSTIARRRGGLLRRRR